MFRCLGRGLGAGVGAGDMASVVQKYLAAVKQFGWKETLYKMYMVSRGVRAGGRGSKAAGRRGTARYTSLPPERRPLPTSLAWPRCLSQDHVFRDNIDDMLSVCMYQTVRIHPERR
jgi:hypothetical protein